MKTKKLLALLLAGAMSASLLAGCGGNTDTAATDDTADTTEQSTETESDLAYVQDKGTLVVGITDFAPMDYRDDNGEWIGFDADMAREVAEALGVEVQFSEIEWGNKLMELDNKSVDCLWNGMTITDEITGGASATNPYATNAQVVVLKADVAGDYQDAASLSGLNFAVEAGSAGEAAAQEAGLTYVSVSDQATALMEVSSGTSDACIVDLLMAGAMIGEGTSYPDLTYTVRLTEEDYGVGCRKGSDLTDFINEQLKVLYDDGTIAELAEQYGPYDGTAAAVDHALHLLGLRTDSMAELNYYDRKRVHNLKYYTWVEQQGRTAQELNDLWYGTVWDDVHRQADQLDALINAFNEESGVLTNL